jgi:hypothetical protein
MQGNLAAQVAWLEELQTVITEGVKKHPYDNELKSLEDRLKHEYLSFAVK